jgi:SAM-dependent methyltransferase
VFRHHRCGDCRTVFIDPVPTQQQLAAVYDWATYHGGYVDTSWERDHKTLTRLERYGCGAMRLLDFGCGTGAFLRRAKAAGYQATGAEITDKVAREASAKAGVPVVSLEALLAGPYEFDVVHARDVLAHLVDPRATLADLVKHLSPQGLLVLDDPIEENPSLVHAAAKAWSRLSRDTGVRPSGRGPTMLARMTSRSHQRLVDGLGLTVLACWVTETGWPYYVAGKPITTRAARLKACIGWSAKALWWLDPTDTLGNRIFLVCRRTGARG